MILFSIFRIIPSNNSYQRLKLFGCIILIATNFIFIACIFVLLFNDHLRISSIENNINHITGDENDLAKFQSILSFMESVNSNLITKVNEFQKTQMVIESSNLGKQLNIYDLVDLISRGWKSEKKISNDRRAVAPFLKKMWGLACRVTEKKIQNQFIACFPIFKLQCNCVGDNVLGMDYAVSLAFLLQQKYHIPSVCPEKM